MTVTGVGTSGAPTSPDDRGSRAWRSDAARTILLLIGLALGIRLVVAVLATVFGPDGSVGDVVFHAQMVHGPIAHLQGHQPDTAQYAPYLGLLEWITTGPWSAMGAGDLTALRLSSITWDLIGMVILLLATARRFPDRLWLVGLLWAAAPIFWPASAYSAQDELIVSALVAGVVYLLFTERRLAAVALCVAGLFLVKILLLPVVVALVLTTKRDEIREVLAGAATTFLVMVGLTLLLTGSDGLTQQGTYEVDVIGFSVSIWSSLVLHHVIDPRPAIRLSLVFVAAAVTAALVLWWRHRPRVADRLAPDRLAPDRLTPDRLAPDLLEGPRLGAALLLAAFAFLAVSNPEYLCIAAPLAIVGCIGLERTIQPWLLVAAGAIAWATNAVYYLLRTGYDPTGSLLGLEGFAHPIEGREVLLDRLHQGLLVAFVLVTLLLAWNLLTASDRRSSPVT